MTRALSSAIAGPWPIRVFAVDDCSAQLTWAASPAEGLRLEVGDVVVHPQPSAPVELVLDNGGVAASVAGPGQDGALQRWAEGTCPGGGYSTRPGRQAQAPWSSTGWHRVRTTT